jgi:hypothetical protein
MNQLEDFLQGKPLNERMKRLMDGYDYDEEDAEAQSPTPEARTHADGTAITNDDREHLRRMLAMAGWQVLLKLLDTDIQDQEDTARRISKDALTPNEQIVSRWRDVAGAAKARNRMVALAEAEVGKLRKKSSPQRHRGTEKSES